MLVSWVGRCRRGKTPAAVTLPGTIRTVNSWLCDCLCLIACDSPSGVGFPTGRLTRGDEAGCVQGHGEHQTSSVLVIGAGVLGLAPPATGRPRQPRHPGGRGERTTPRRGSHRSSPGSTPTTSPGRHRQHPGYRRASPLAAGTRRNLVPPVRVRVGCVGRRCGRPCRLAPQQDRCLWCRARIWQDGTGGGLVDAAGSTACRQGHLDADLFAAGSPPTADRGVEVTKGLVTNVYRHLRLCRCQVLLDGTELTADTVVIAWCSIPRPRPSGGRGGRSAPRVLVSSGSCRHRGSAGARGDLRTDQPAPTPRWTPVVQLPGWSTASSGRRARQPVDPSHQDALLDGVRRIMSPNSARCWGQISLLTGVPLGRSLPEDGFPLSGSRTAPGGSTPWSPIPG